jgi:hypothetical protein
MNVGHSTDPGCYSRGVNYSATNRQMAALVELSSECHQSFKVSSNKFFTKFFNVKFYFYKIRVAFEIVRLLFHNICVRQHRLFLVEQQKRQREIFLGWHEYRRSHLSVRNRRKLRGSFYQVKLRLFCNYSLLKSPSRAYLGFGCKIWLHSSSKEIFGRYVSNLSESLYSLLERNFRHVSIDNW